MYVLGAKEEFNKIYICTVLERSMKMCTVCREVAIMAFILLTFDTPGFALSLFVGRRPPHSTIGGVGVSTNNTAGIVDPCHNIDLEIERQTFEEEIVAFV